MQAEPRQEPPIIAVPAASAETAWPYAEEWVRSAAEPAGYTSDYILEQIQSARMQLWLGEDFACVTQVHSLPLFRVLVILLLAGENMATWFEDLVVHLEDWGRQIDCRYIECHGRRGWQRMGKSLGYKPMWQTLRKEL